VIPIPRHKSKLPKIEITIESFNENIAEGCRGEHWLEDWYWEIRIDNYGNEFCPPDCFWGVYVVRSTIDQPIRFNTRGDNYEIIQLLPDDKPKLLMVDDVTADKQTGVALRIIIERPVIGTLEMIHGLHMYNS